LKKEKKETLITINYFSYLTFLTKNLNKYKNDEKITLKIIGFIKESSSMFENCEIIYEILNIYFSKKKKKYKIISDCLIIICNHTNNSDYLFNFMANFVDKNDLKLVKICLEIFLSFRITKLDHVNYFINFFNHFFIIL
jgi:hypothetical protein